MTSGNCLSKFPVPATQGHFSTSQKKPMDTVSSRCPITVNAANRAPNPEKMTGLAFPAE
nr:MAG TPA: hypothetical protein [Bacteriophage sp.]